MKNENNENTVRKTRPDDVLGNLPREKRDFIVRLLGHMSYNDVIKRVAEPPPLGLDLKIEYTSLRRFYTKHLPEELVGSRRQEMHSLQGLAEVCAAEPAPYDELIREFFTKSVFYQSLGLPYQDERFRENMRLLLDLRSQELKEKYFELQKTRVETEKSKNKPDVTLQIFAVFQAQIEQMIAKSLAQAGPPAAVEHREAQLLSQSNPADAQPIEAKTPENPPDEVSASTEKHALARNSTL